MGHLLSVISRQISVNAYSEKNLIKKRNNLIIQWGFSATKTSTQVAINLPIAFSNTNYCIVASGYDGASYGSYNYEVRNYNKKVDSFYLWVQQTGYSWIAIGY